MTFEFGPSDPYWRNPNPGSPWIPPTYEAKPSLADRDALYYWSTQISGLPGRFVYPLFNSRLHASIRQTLGVAPSPEGAGAAPSMSVYESLRTPADLVDAVRYLDSLRLLRADDTGKVGYSVRVTVNLYASAFSSARERRLRLPAPGDSYRGDHRMFLHSVDGDDLLFSHNWDSWRETWRMPIAYLEKEFVEASCFGGLRAANVELDAGLQADSVGYEPDRYSLSSDVILLSPADVVLQVLGARGLSVLGRDRLWSCNACVTVGAQVLVIGWALLRVPADGEAFVEELFVNPALRGMGVATTLMGTIAFYLHMGGHKAVKFVKTRADIAVETRAERPPLQPHWLRDGWRDDPDAGPKSAPQQVKRMAVFDLLGATVARDSRAYVAEWGVAGLEHYALYPSPESVPRQPKMAIMLDPAKFNRRREEDLPG